MSEDEVYKLARPISVNDLPRYWIARYRARRYLADLSDNELDIRLADILSNAFHLGEDGKYRPRFHVDTANLYAPIRHIDYLRLMTDAWDEGRLRGHKRGGKNLASFGLQLARHGAAEWRVRNDWTSQSKLSLETYENPKMLFRFGTASRNRDFVTYGRVRFAPASLYKDHENNAVRDDELSVSWAGVNGTKGQLSAPDYYALCMAAEYDLRLYEDFGADSCVAIHDPREFRRRMVSAILSHNRAGREPRIQWMYCCPAIYYDPFDLAPLSAVHDIQFLKHFRFAYQTEYRFVVTPKEAGCLAAFFLDIGSLEDISVMISSESSQS